MSTLPSSISLARYSGPIFDQGQQGSCVENAICGVLALQANEYHRPIAPLAREQLYNDTRSMMGTFSYDSGSVVKYAYKVAMETGIANDSSFPYGTNNSNLYVHPSDAVYKEAATQKVLSVTNLNIYQSYTALTDTIKQALLQGKGVLCSTQHLTLADGSLIDGGHQFIIVGADDATQTYTFQNSWGAAWGDHGYGTIKYSEFAVGWSHPANELLGLDIINGFKGVDLTWTETRREVGQLYASVLERAGENFGITAWAQQVDGGLSISSLADIFYGSQEGQTLYGAMNNAQYVNEVFHNILGRDADAAGSAFFQDQLAHGTTRGALAANIMQYIDTYNGTDASTIASHDFLENRTTVSMDYGISYQVDGKHYAAAVHALQNVTSNADNLPVVLVGIQHELGWS